MNAKNGTAFVAKLAPRRARIASPRVRLRDAPRSDAARRRTAHVLFPFFLWAPFSSPLDSF